MKYFITIVFVVLISLGTGFLISQKSSNTVQEVKINAEMEKDEKGEWVLKIVLKNETSNKVSIAELGKEWVEFRLDMWAILGQGIQLYRKNDAEWRRHQAFPIMKPRFIEPGMSKEIILVLDEMMPAYPDNDELARSIIDDYKKYEYKEAYLRLQYSLIQDEDKEEYFEKYLPVIVKL